MKDRSKTREQLLQELEELRRQNVELRKSEEKLRELIDLAPDGVIAISRLGFVISINRAFTEITGFGEDEIVGRHFTRIGTLRLKDLPLYRKLFADIINGRSLEPVEFIYKRKNGITGIGEGYMTPLRENGKIAGMLIIARDITKRKESERALIESEERYRLLADESPLGISIVGADGLYKYINARFKQMFGYTLEDIPTGREWFQKAYPDAEYRKKVISTWISDLTVSISHESRPRTFSAKCKNGEICKYEWQIRCCNGFRS